MKSICLKVLIPAFFPFTGVSLDGVLKILNLLRCFNFSIIMTYASTPK